MLEITPISENHIRISRAYFDEGMRAVENKSYKKSVKKLTCFLLLLYLAVALWLWYTGGSLIFLLGESIFLGALLFWLLVMLPGTRRRSKYRAMTQGGDGICERTVRFYRDHLVVIANTGKETTISYNDVLSWQETQNLYILNCNHNSSVMLDKNGFVVGEFQMVEALLKNRD
ncbi:YcxB family protein [Roseburia hominis]